MCYFEHVELFLFFHSFCFFIFAVMNLHFFLKRIDQKDRYQYLKQKQNGFISLFRQSKCTNPFLQLLHINVKGTLVGRGCVQEGVVVAFLK